MNPIVYAIPVFMLTILLEAWVARRRGVAVYDIPDAITSLHHGLLSQVTNAFTKIATLGIYIAVYEAYRFNMGAAPSVRPVLNARVNTNNGTLCSIFNLPTLS